MTDIVERDLTYGVVEGRLLGATLYEPSAAVSTVATLIDVHGGAWTTGDRRSNRLLDRALAARGCRVIAIDFRHGPAFRHPAAIRDIVAAVRCVRVRADELAPGSPGPLGLLGSSSGGHLALLAALLPNADAHRGTAVALADGGTAAAGDVDAGVDHVIALWPVSDPLRRYRYARGAGRDDLADRHLQYFADESEMERASVQRVLRAGEAERVPAALVVQPGADQNVPVAMTVDLVEAYQAAGGVLDYAFYPRLPHAFAHRESAATDDLVRVIAAFVERRAAVAWEQRAAGAAAPS